MNDEAKQHLYKNNLRCNYDEKNDTYIIPVPVLKWGGEKILVFECPFCKQSWKKNGEPCKTSLPVYHRHGDDGKDMDGNYGFRTPHCSDEARRYWNLPNFQFKLIGNNMIF